MLQFRLMVKVYWHMSADLVWLTILDRIIQHLAKRHLKYHSSYFYCFFVWFFEFYWCILIWHLTVLILRSSNILVERFCDQSAVDKVHQHHLPCEEMRSSRKWVLLLPLTQIRNWQLSREPVVRSERFVPAAQVLQFIPQTGPKTTDPSLRKKIRQHARGHVSRSKGVEKVAPLLHFHLIVPKFFGGSSSRSSVILTPELSFSSGTSSPNNLLSEPELEYQDSNHSPSISGYDTEEFDTCK